jgi:2-pyrone-4,6-dicarboxylate lactonase
MRSVQKRNPPTTKSRLVPPPGACDTHLHVYGPTEKYPLSRQRNYTPDLHSTLDDYLQVHRSLGVQRAVIVTGSANGTNNEVTVDALSRMRKFQRPCAIESGDQGE